MNDAEKKIEEEKFRAAINAKLLPERIFIIVLFVGGLWLGYKLVTKNG